MARTRPSAPLAALLTFALALPALADEYPTKPDEKDRLCEDIGRSKDPSIPPQDRIWFMESCMCLDRVGCGAPGSPRLAARVEAQRRADDALLQAEIDRQAALEKERAESKASALKEMQQACVPLADCFQKNAENPAACEPMESKFDHDCSATVRDSEACAQAARAAAETRAPAGCQAALR